MRDNKISSLFPKVIFSFIFLFSGLVQAQLIAFPDDDPDSGRMINVTRGFNTLGEAAADGTILNLSIRVPASEPNVTIDIFDGDSNIIYDDVTQGFWDGTFPTDNTVTPDDVIFRLYPDPLLTGNTSGTPILSVNGNTMADNDWTNFISAANDLAAVIPSGEFAGDFGYHLVAEWVTEDAPDMQNAFKVRANGLVFVLAGSTVGFQGYASIQGPGGSQGNTDEYPFPLSYNGTFNLAVLLNAENNCVLDIYDADLDRLEDGILPDGDDFNTPNDGVSAGGFYPFPLSAVTQDESNHIGQPADDSPIVLLRKLPGVQYSVTGPTGLLNPGDPETYNVVNTNPSGNREFELFRIVSTAPGCPPIPADPNDYDPEPLANGIDPPQAAPDVTVAGIGQGFHFISVTGLDALNNAFINAIGDIVSVDALADFSDAPQSYNSGGLAPSHQVVGNLLMGAAIDQELNALPSPNADGDDNFGSDDEDAVTFTNALADDAAAGSSYLVDVNVSNGLMDGASNPVTAKLIGWIDFDGNGMFEIDESAMLDIPSTGAAVDVQLDFTIPADINAGDTYARFRLTSDVTINTGTPFGPAEDGEVEDYTFTIDPGEEECIPCKGMKNITFKMSDWDRYGHFKRDPNEIVRVRVGDLLGRFNGSDFAAPILFEGTVPNGGTIAITDIDDDYLGMPLTISVQSPGNHPVEYGKARFYPDCDLQLWTKSGNNYIKFKVISFEKNSEEICECVECEVGPAEITFKITNTHGRDQNETIRVRVGHLSGSLPSPNNAVNPVIFTGIVANGGTFVVTVPEEHRGKTLSITVQGRYHYHEFAKARFHADCDLKTGDFSSLNGYLKVKVYDLQGDTGETCPNECPPGSTAGYVKDHFSYRSYDNNDGNRDWNGPWKETDKSGGGATGGNVKIYHGKLKLRKKHSSIEREVNLCASTDVWLKFQYVMSYKVDPSDKVAVEVSPDGGLSWHLIDTYAGRHGWRTKSYNISEYASANTRVRFRISKYYGGYGEWFYVNWIKISSN